MKTKILSQLEQVEPGLTAEDLATILHSPQESILMALYSLQDRFQVFRDQWDRWHFVRLAEAPKPIQLEGGFKW
jgi:hypothetical protein